MQPANLHSLCQYFSRSARRYHQHATLQQRIADELAERYLHSMRPESILELGCGTGFLTRNLVDRFPDTMIDAVDISGEMIQLAQNVLPAPNIRWQVADMNRMPWDRPYDLIASSTALHWGDPLDRLIQRISTQLCPGGKLVAVVMSAGTLAELHQVRQEVAPRKTPPRKLPTEEELTGYLARSSMTVCQSSCVTYRQSYPSSREFIRSLQLTGFTGGPFSHRESDILVRSELEALLQRYQQQHGNPDGTVHATFQATFFAAKPNGEREA